MATLETTAHAPADRERLLAIGAALITVTLWASAFVGIRDAARHFSPGALALGRLSIAAVALGLIVLARREPLPLGATSASSPSSGSSGSGSTTSLSTRPSSGWTPAPPRCSSTSARF